MDPLFPQRYMRVVLDATEERIKQRSSTIDGLAEQTKDSDISGLIGVLRGHVQQGATIDALRAAFQAQDLTFPMSDNDRELAVLAAQLVINLIGGKRASLADKIAVAVITSDCLGAAPRLEIPELTELAETYLSRRQILVRQAVSDTSRAQLNISLGKALSDWDVTPDVTATGLTTILNTAAKDIGGLATSLDTSVNQLHEKLRILDERSAVILFCLTGYAAKFENELKALGSFQHAAAAVELCECTRIMPGLRAAGAYISTALKSKPKEMTLPAMLKGASLSWGERFETGRLGAIVVPYSAAIRNWATGMPDWETRSLRDARIGAWDSLDALIIARQIYLERLLVAVIGNA